MNQPKICFQCKKEYKSGITQKGCRKCAPGVIVLEREFRLPIKEGNK